MSDINPNITTTESKEDELEQLIEEVKQAKSELDSILAEARATATDISTAKDEVDNSVSSIDDAYVEIFGTEETDEQEESPGILEDLKNAIEIANTAKNTYQTTTTELETKLEDLETTVTEASTAHDEAKDLKNKVLVLHKNSSDYFDTIRGYINEIEGYNEKPAEGEEVGNHIEGLKEKLETAYEEIEEKVEILEENYKEYTKKFTTDFVTFIDEKTVKAKELENKLNKLHGDKEAKIERLIKDFQNRYTNQEDTIKTLLSGATTVGLSEVYSKKKEEEIIELARHRRSFKSCINFISMSSFIVFGFVSLIYLKLQTMENGLDIILRLTSFLLPAYAGLVWLAWSANKELKLSKRLVEEYSHKESLARTYQGFIEQLETFDEDDYAAYELRVRLLHNMISASAENPGKLMKDYNETDHPVLEVLNKSMILAESIDKIEKIPGMSKVVKALQRREVVANKEVENKLKDGLADHIALAENSDIDNEEGSDDNAKA